MPRRTIHAREPLALCTSRRPSESRAHRSHPARPSASSSARTTPAISHPSFTPKFEHCTVGYGSDGQTPCACPAACINGSALWCALCAVCPVCCVPCVCQRGGGRDLGGGGRDLGRHSSPPPLHTPLPPSAGHSAAARCAREQCGGRVALRALLRASLRSGRPGCPGRWPHGLRSCAEVVRGRVPASRGEVVGVGAVAEVAA